MNTKLRISNPNQSQVLNTGSLARASRRKEELSKSSGATDGKGHAPGELTWASRSRWTREELQELVKRGSPRGGRSGSPENEAGAGQCCEAVGFGHSCRVPALFFFAPAGSLWETSAVGQMPQTLAASSLRPASQLTRSPFPRAASPSNSPSPALKPEVRAVPRTHARRHRRLVAAPRRERAGGRLGRAHFRDAARDSGVSSPGGLQSFRARESTGWEWAPLEALKEKVVDLGTRGPPQE